MKQLLRLSALALVIFFTSCENWVREEGESISITDSLAAFSDSVALADTVMADSVHVDTLKDTFFEGKEIDTKNVRPEEVVAFAKTLIGVPYLYASTDPAKGFDCSGFITYVFHHFGIIVPRSSIDFTLVGRPVDESQAMPGDLVLFTGTDSTEKFVGHMGLVVANDQDGIQFIHSTSGKKYGVTISPLEGYYRGRYVKTIRIFKQLLADS